VVQLAINCPVDVCAHIFGRNHNVLVAKIRPVQAHSLLVDVDFEIFSDFFIRGDGEDAKLAVLGKGCKTVLITLTELGQPHLIFVALYRQLALGRNPF